MHRIIDAMRWISAILLGVVLSPVASAEDIVIRRADGSPAARSTVTTVGQATTIETDDAGRIALERLPDPPFTIVVIDRDGTVYPRVSITSIPDGADLVVQLAPAYREEITVVSGIAPGIQSLPGSATTMLGAEELEIRPLRNAADAVDETPGASRSEKFQAAVPSLRGMTRGRTLILFDGSPLSTERRAGASATFVDPFTLAAVDVARGPGSVTYGSDAFGGVIDLRPRYPRAADGESIRFRLQASTLAEDLVGGGAEWSQPAGPGALLLQAHGRRAHDSEDPDGRVLLDSSFRDHGFAARWTMPVLDGELRAGITVDEGRDIGRPTTGSAESSTVYPIESSRRLDLTTALPRPASWMGLEAKATIGRYRLDLVRDTSGDIEASDVRSNDAAVRVTGTRRLGEGILNVGGSVVSRFDLEAVDRFGPADDLTTSVSISDASRVDAALFSSWDVPMSSTATLSIGGRVDAISSRARGESFGRLASSHTAPSGYVALTSRASDNSTAAIQISSGFRDPTLSDRYFTGPTARGFITGNPDLDPERSLQFDGLWRWSRGSQTVTLAGYSYRIDDLIERYKEGRNYFFRNRGVARVRGIEIESSSRIGRQISLDLAASWSRGSTDGGDPMDGIEPPNARATFRWYSATRYGYATVRTLKRDNRPGPSEVAVPSYTTVDLGGGWRFRKNLEIRFNLDNVLDERYPASPDEDAVLAPGRSLTLTLEGTF